MGVWNRVLDGLLGPAVPPSIAALDLRPEAVRAAERAAQAKATLPLAVGAGARAIGAPRTDVAALAAARARNELVYACIQIKAMAAADPRLLVQQRNRKGEWEEAAGHPLRRLLLRPNPQMDEAEFIQAAVVSWDVSHRFYCEIVRSRAGVPVELWPLDPLKVTPRHERNADGSQTLKGYEWRDGTYRKEIPPEDMLVRSRWEIGGTLPPLAVAMGAVDADNAQTDYIRTFFNNAGVPSGILHIKNRSLDEPASERLKAQWKAKYARLSGRQHDIAVLDENAEFTRLGANLDELDSEGLRSVAESRICMVFGVPPLIVYAYVGLLRATYSNLDEAWEQFWKTTMSALLREWRTFFTRALLPEFASEELIFGERVRLAWDLSQVAALQEDVEAVHKREHRKFVAGGATLNEYRAALGMTEWADPAVGALNPYLLRLIASVASAAPASGQIVEEPKRAGTLPPSAKGKAASDDDELSATEREVARVAEALLGKHYQQAAEAVRSG